METNTVRVDGDVHSVWYTNTRTFCTSVGFVSSKYDDTCNSTIAETVLDAMLYVGWNNTELCCQVTDPQTSTIVKEKCEMIRLIPGKPANSSSCLKPVLNMGEVFVRRTYFGQFDEL